MNCPKCKTEVSPQDTICPKCNFKLTIKCPKCGNDVRRGLATCNKCGFVFVKFCPQCNSANYLSATQCRKCFYEFQKEPKEKEKPKESLFSEKKSLKEKLREKTERIEKANNLLKNLIFYIHFINLNDVFSRYPDEEFKQKILMNIKTAIKMGFNSICEFTKDNEAVFKVRYSKTLGITKKIEKFKDEFEKFNDVLSDTLGLNIPYKFAVLSEEEYLKKGQIEQISLGGENDIITSEGAYKILYDEISLVKITPKSYKMVILEQKSISAQSETTPFNTAFDMIVEAIEDKHSEIRAISLNAPRGVGKTYLLNKLINKYQGTEHILLLGQASPLTQVTPFGLFQDIFLSLFDLDFVSDKFDKKLKDIKEYLSNNLPGNFDVNSSAIETLSNLLYPNKEDVYENILVNKERTFKDLELILKNLKKGNRLVLIIDDFNLIDEASFEFLKYLVQNDFLDSDTKILLSYKNQNSIEMYIQNEKLKKTSCLNINLAHKTIREVKNYIKERFGVDNLLPKKISDQIILHAQGNVAYIEQVFDYFIESKKILIEKDGVSFDMKYEDFCVPQNLDDILDLRYEILKNQSKIEFNLLNLASLLGGKFTKDILQDVLELDEAKFEKTIQMLIQKDFIQKLDQRHFIFKNNLIWHYVYNKIKESPDFKELEGIMLSELCQKIVASPSIKALIAQAIDDDNLSYEFWVKSLSLICYIGDVGLYVLSQKQILNLIDKVKVSNAPYLKNIINENLGKLVYNKRPNEAFEYLTSAISCTQKNGDDNKIVELSGYLIESLRRLQKYPAIVETVDTVLGVYSKPKMELQRALIKTRKLKALFYMGNWEEIVNLVNNEINPILEQNLKSFKSVSYISQDDIYKTKLNSNIILAQSYAIQGNPVSFEILDEIEREINKNKLKSNDMIPIKVNFMLSRAIAYTMKGMVSASDEILQAIVKDFSYTINDNEIISTWNLIDITNKIFKMEFDNIKEDLFEAVSFADDMGDNFSKNILKIFLADVLLEEGDVLKSLEICSKQMTYCSEEKIALGVLIAWYISAKATLSTDGIDKAIEICDKSIQICKNSKINNTFFNVLFNMVLANAYLMKGELDNAKMYSELALQLSRTNELLYLQMQTLRIRANCMKDTLSTLSDVKKLDMKDNIIRIFEKAIGLSNRLNCHRVSYLIQKDLTAFKAHCQLAGIDDSLN